MKLHNYRKFLNFKEPVPNVVTQEEDFRHPEDGLLRVASLGIKLKSRVEHGFLNLTYNSLCIK